MKIAVDISRALEPHKSGIHVYQSNLFRSLMEIDSRHEFIPLFYGYQANHIINFMDKKVLSVHNRYLHRSIFLKDISDQVLIKKRIQGKADILHSTANFSIRGFEDITVLTIHDLIFMRDPKCYNDYHTKLMRHMVGRVKKIIAVSNATKNEILKEFPSLPEKKITVIYEGAREDCSRIENKEKLVEFKNKFFGDANFEYILFLGGFTSRKNILNIVRAYDYLVKKRNVRHKLVLIGKPLDAYEKTLALIDELGLKEFAVVKPNLPDQFLPYLLNAADVFVFPSLYEGFGLPVIEAMQCGCPCVISNSSALQELFADSALTVDPSLPEDIGNGILKFLTDPLLREKYKELGFKKSRIFNWKKTAEATLRLYESVI